MERPLTTKKETIIETGKGYHIKDEFFALVKDDTLRQNKGEHFRPNFFLFESSYYPGIYWAIPLSSRIEKYKKLIKEKKKKYGKCETIVIAKYGEYESAFLIQNIFPIIPKFVDHEHIHIDGTSYKLAENDKNLLIKYAKDCLQQYKKGNHKIIYTHIEDDFLKMIFELENGKRQ